MNLLSHKAFHFPGLDSGPAEDDTVQKDFFLALTLVFMLLIQASSVTLKAGHTVSGGEEAEGKPVLVWIAPEGTLHVMEESTGAVPLEELADSVERRRVPEARLLRVTVVYPPEIAAGRVFEVFRTLQTIPGAELSQQLSDAGPRN